MNRSGVRGWLIFAAIVALILALPLLKIRAVLAVSKMGPLLLLLGGAFLLLAFRPWRRRGGNG